MLRGRNTVSTLVEHSYGWAVQDKKQTKKQKPWDKKMIQYLWHRVNTILQLDIGYGMVAKDTKKSGNTKT